MQSIATLLRTIPGFVQLDSASLDQVAAASDLAEAAPGDVLFNEGGAPDWLYVLLEGRVSLTGTASDASSTVIDILEPSSSFVLANVLSEEPYLMAAQTISSARLVRIAAEPMRALVAVRPGAAMAMMGAMSAGLANMTRQVVDLKVRIAAQRLATYLLGLVRDPAATKSEFRLPVPKGLLAPWLGCRAENLSRAFQALRAYGVETHGGRVLLHDIARLRSYAGLSDGVVFGKGAAIGATDVRQPVEKIFGDAFKLRRRRGER